MQLGLPEQRQKNSVERVLFNTEALKYVQGCKEIPLQYWPGYLLRNICTGYTSIIFIQGS